MKKKVKYSTILLILKTMKKCDFNIYHDLNLDLGLDSRHTDDLNLKSRSRSKFWI